MEKIPLTDRYGVTQPVDVTLPGFVSYAIKHRKSVRRTYRHKFTLDSHASVNTQTCFLELLQDIDISNWTGI